jgi:hypothetical protein
VTRQAGASIDLPPGEVAALAGRYHSVELDATYELGASSSALVVRRPRGEVDTLHASEQGVFRASNYSLRFAPPSQAMRAFTLDNGRVRGIEFVREP